MGNNEFGSRLAITWTAAVKKSRCVMAQLVWSMLHQTLKQSVPVHTRCARHEVQCNRREMESLTCSFEMAEKSLFRQPPAFFGVVRAGLDLGADACNKSVPNPVRPRLLVPIRHGGHFEGIGRIGWSGELRPGELVHLWRIGRRCRQLHSPGLPAAPRGVTHGPVSLPAGEAGEIPLISPAVGGVPPGSMKPWGTRGVCCYGRQAAR